MINIRIDSNNRIIAIYSIEMQGCITVDSLPDDFEKYLNEGKYLANETGLYIKPGWVDYNLLEIPTNPIVDYVMSTDCPSDTSLIRHVYWDGEEHETDKYFMIYLIVLHFRPDGSRVRNLDKRTWTRADKGVMRENPLLPGETVDEYDLFKDMINSVNMPQLIQLGIYASEETLNKRLYDSQ